MCAIKHKVSFLVSACGALIRAKMDVYMRYMTDAYHMTDAYVLYDAGINTAM